MKSLKILFLQKDTRVSSLGRNKESGFVIMFAVLVASIIFMLGAGLFSVAQKENLLASSSTESQIALGAADTGAECALYYAFSQVSGAPISSFNCAGHTNIPGQTVGQTTVYPFDLTLISDSNNPGKSVACGVVMVTTGSVRNGVSGTELQVRGFNICSGGTQSGILKPDSSDPLLVERKLVVWYADMVPTPTVVTPPAGGSVGVGGNNTTTVTTPPPIVNGTTSTMMN